MKRRNSKAKLRLSRETVQQLSGDQLVNAAGACDFTQACGDTGFCTFGCTDPQICGNGCTRYC